MLAKEAVNVPDSELAPIGVIESNARQATLVPLQGLHLSFTALSRYLPVRQGLVVPNRVREVLSHLGC